MGHQIALWNYNHLNNQGTGAGEYGGSRSTMFYRQDF